MNKGEIEIILRALKARTKAAETAIKARRPALIAEFEGQIRIEFQRAEIRYLRRHLR